MGARIAISNNPTPATMAAVRSDTLVKRGAFSLVFVMFSSIFRLTCVDLLPTLGHRRPHDGLAQCRNANDGAYYPPHKRENPTDKCHPANVRLEKNNSGDVRLECNRQCH